MIRVFLTMLVLQVLALTVAMTGYGIVAVLVSTWLAYFWGKHRGVKEKNAI